jgi:predicted  nucleic acid-binding Zn-ribbon protein
MSVKDLLENELSGVNMQRDMMQKDFINICDEHEALKVAYHSLETENMNNLVSQKSKINNNNLTTKQLLDAANEKILNLEDEIALNSKRIKECEFFQTRYNEQEQKIRNFEDEKTKFDLKINTIDDELKSYKKLVETLTNKIKDLSGRGNRDTKEFLDSFEEVMRDEMMTMKTAFEMKLRSAKQEAEITSRKHHQEILRLQANRSPFSALLVSR